MFKGSRTICDRDRRHGRTVLSSSWRHPSPWSVSSFFQTCSCPAAFVTTLFLIYECRLLASRRQSRPSARRNSHVRPRTAMYVPFPRLFPLRVTLHAPDAWQMKKNSSRRSRASFGAFPQAHLYNVTTGSSKSSHKHQRHHYLRYPRSSKSLLGPKALLVPRTCLARDSARNHQNPCQRECVYGSSARHCGGYHAVARLYSRFACT
jgi:hypothetical protein